MCDFPRSLLFRALSKSFVSRINGLVGRVLKSIKLAPPPPAAPQAAGTVFRDSLKLPEQSKLPGDGLVGLLGKTVCVCADSFRERRRQCRDKKRFIALAW